MLKLLGQAGVPTSGLIAKLAGGSNMFGHSGPLQIGVANGEAAVRALAGAGIRVVAQDMGGNQGRRIVVRGETLPVLCSIARTGESPWMKSTSGRFNWSSTCRAWVERLSMYFR